MSNIIPISEIEKMASSVSKSGLFGIKTMDQAMALMCIAQAEGRHPALAARDYDIIQGKPAKKSEAMLRDFIQSGGKVTWHKLDDALADATFAHPQGGEVRITWDMARAVAAQLGGKDMWKKYPRQMLRARVVSEGIRTVCPMATSGMYVPEEVQDFDNKSMVDVTPTNQPEDSTTTAKSAYGSSKAMKDKWAQIRDAILECGSDEELEAAKTKYAPDFATIRSIDNQLFDNLIKIGEERRHAISMVNSQRSDMPFAGDIDYDESPAERAVALPEDEKLPEFIGTATAAIKSAQKAHEDSFKRKPA